MKKKQPEYRQLKSIEDLEKACSRPVVVECVIQGDRIRFEGRRLTPDERRRLQVLLELALPPELPPEREGGEPRYDFRDPKYLEARALNRRRARALALYWAFPIFQTETPLNEDQIVERIENSHVDDSVLELAFTLLTQEITAVDPARVGFTSGSSYPND